MGQPTHGQLVAYSVPAALARRTRLVLAPRTGRNQYHAAGVLGRTRHCIEAAAVAHCRKTCWHPQNRKYITYRDAAREGPSHGHGQHAQKIWLSLDVWFSRYASRHTHRDVARQNTRLPYRGRSSLIETVLKRFTENPQNEVQESCAIAKMTARCAHKSKQTATPPPKITWLSVDSVQPDVMDVGVERTFSSQNFTMFPCE